MYKRIYLFICLCCASCASLILLCKSVQDIQDQHDLGKEANSCNSSVELGQNSCKTVVNVHINQNAKRKQNRNQLSINKISKRILEFQKQLVDSVKKSKNNNSDVVLDLEYEKYLSQIAKLCEELLQINKKITVLGDFYVKRYVDMYVSTYGQCGSGSGCGDGDSGNSNDDSGDSEDEDGDEVSEK